MAKLLYWGPAPNLWPSQEDTRWDQLSDYHLGRLSRSCCWCSGLHRTCNRHVGIKRSANTLICASMNALLQLQGLCHTAQRLSALIRRERCTRCLRVRRLMWRRVQPSFSHRVSRWMLGVSDKRCLVLSALPEQIKISQLGQDGLFESRNLLATSGWQWHRC